MMKVVNSRRRMLRRKLKRPHERHRRDYVHANKNEVKIIQKKKKVVDSNKRRKIKPKTDKKGYKMAYRYRYYNYKDKIFHEEESDDDSS